ncbi:hypothetical protein [Oceaniglobus indicus]|uniref:hypothetical protein n=1 Tax=Oceaniglobus indicus TaxID=2047749 RepID=UPI000C1966FF|nr:hypothetical protein [Oceaniglobus indicus]
MSVKNFLSAVTVILALFAMAWIARLLFQSDPALLVSKLMLLAPILGSAVLLIRLTRRTGRQA